MVNITFATIVICEENERKTKTVKFRITDFQTYMYKTKKNTKTVLLLLEKCNFSIFPMLILCVSLLIHEP